MKLIKILFFSLILIIALGGSKVSYYQTVATGHMTAEVIESISASSQAVTSYALETTVSNISLTQGQPTLTSPSINPGVMTINSGNMFTVNIVLQSSVPSSSSDSISTSDLTLDNKLAISDPKSNASASIPKVITNAPDSLATALLQGTYTVVFACN